MKRVLIILAVLLVAGLVVAEGLDDAEFGPGVSRVQPVGFMRDETTPDSVDEGDQGIGRMSANRCQYIMLRDGDGNERGADVNSSDHLEVQDDTVNGSLTSDNDAKELADYFDSSSQLSPLYVNDNSLGQDNEPIADVMAAYYDMIDAVVNASNQVDVNIAAQTLTALKVSKDASANADGNRIYVTSNVDKLGGNAINTNGGNKDTGTQTVTLADNDPAVTNLSDIEGLLTSDNDAKEITDYFDSSSQLSPFYVDDNTLGQDNEPIADVMAEQYDLLDAVCNASNQVDINIAAQGLTAVKVSKDASANATANRIYVTSNVDQIGGTAVNTNGGNKDGGTQTVILADDDPAVTSLAIVDDWDAVHDSAVSSDGPQVMGSARTSQMTAVDNGDAVRVVTNDHGELVLAGYSWSNSNIAVAEADPVSEHHTETTPVDETDLTDNTTYYAYWDMDGYRNFTLQCDMNIETDSITATLECTVQDDGTAQGSCFYTDVTNDLTGAASVIDSDFIWIVDTPVMFKYCRLAYAVADEDGNDSDLTCFLKRGY